MKRYPNFNYFIEDNTIVVSTELRVKCTDNKYYLTPFVKLYHLNSECETISALHGMEEAHIECINLMHTISKDPLELIGGLPLYKLDNSQAGMIIEAGTFEAKSCTNTEIEHL